MSSLSPAERVLQELGITDPSEIDLEAIAWHLGARIKFRELDDCEARIIGYRERAVITIDRRSPRRRRRFSIAHELGHWRHHRNRMLMCRSDDIGSRSPRTPRIERVADGYAADLVLPHYLFVPISRQYNRLNFQTVRSLAELFDTSLTATAIRLTESKHSPAVLICHGPGGRKWFTRSPDLPDRWFPQEELDAESFAFELLFGSGQEEAHPRVIGADAWFDRSEAQRYEVHEQSVRIGEDEILTLLTIRDDEMLEDRSSTSSWRRRS